MDNRYLITIVLLYFIYTNYINYINNDNFTNTKNSNSKNSNSKNSNSKSNLKVELTISDNEDTIKNKCGNITIDKCFLLTLKESQKRRDTFLQSYKNCKCDIPLEIIWGINTKIPENTHQYSYLISNEKYKNMYKYDTGELVRPDHTYFNSGALGCYLGHMEFYKKCFQENLKYAIIFEDNVILSNNFTKELNNALKQLPYNFSVCFLHAHSSVHNIEKVCYNEIKKIKLVLGTKCYLINVESMKNFYPLFYPIQNHVDRIYERLSYEGANIYLINLPSISLSNSKSTINHTNVIDGNKQFFYFKN